MRPASASFTALSAFLSIAALAGCGPSLNTAYKAELDKRLAGLPVSDQSYSPPESFLPMGFSVGQWTQHRISDDKGLPALLTYKLVGQENGAYWIEIIHETYKGRKATKMLVALLAGRDPSGMEVRAVRTKVGNGAVVDIGLDALAGTQADFRPELDLLAATWEGQQQDDVRVPAGKFIGCYKSDSSTPWGPWQAPSHICAHPSVPLSGVVRATPMDKPGVMELVNFGLTGAESEFP